MKVFISWSGERSKAVAESLRYWLPKVIQAVQPWMSADDIEKGTRWRTGIASELEKSSVGIICLTPENLDSTWIHFEAGALSRQHTDTYVCTFLYSLEPTDVQEPLAQFQATRAQKEDVRKLIFTINNALGDSKLPESELNETLDMWLPKLEERLRQIGPLGSPTKPLRTDRELIEEVLSIVRSQQTEKRAVEELSERFRELSREALMENNRASLQLSRAMFEKLNNKAMVDQVTAAYEFQLLHQLQSLANQANWKDSPEFEQTLKKVLQHWHIKATDQEFKKSEDGPAR